MKYEWTSKLKNVTYDPTSKEYSWSEEQTETGPYPILTDDIIQQRRLYEFTTNHKDFRMDKSSLSFPVQKNKTKENKK